MYILTIDVGTTSMRGIVYNIVGEVFAMHRVAYENIFPVPGYVEQDPRVWENALMRILGEVAKVTNDKGVEIKGITLTSQRSSVIPLGFNKEPLARAITWQDTRTQEICEQYEEKNEQIFSICGSKMNTVFSASKIVWFKQYQPELYESTYKFVGIADYLLYKMTNELKTDHTYGSRTLLMNLKDKKWDEQLLALFNIEEEKLCELVSPGSIVGYLEKCVAEKVGLQPGIPVITAGGDQQCSIIGKGVISAGNVSVTTGTGAFIIAACDKIPEALSSEIICNVSALQNQYIIETNTLTCTAAFDWFLNNFYDMTTISYEEISQIVEGVPTGSNGCRVLPYFQGKSTPNWNPLARATFANLSLRTTKADLLRALIEGIFCEVKYNLEAMSKFTPISKIYLGGGLSNSMIINQIQANIYDRETYHYNMKEETSLGALLIALVTLGVYQNIEDALANTLEDKQVHTYIPEKNISDSYKIICEELKDLYEKNKDGERRQCLENI